MEVYTSIYLFIPRGLTATEQLIICCCGFFKGAQEPVKDIVLGADLDAKAVTQ